MAKYPRDINLLAIREGSAPKFKTRLLLTGILALIVAAALAVAIPSELLRRHRREYDRLDAERARYTSRELAELLPRRELLAGQEEAAENFYGLPANELWRAVTGALPPGGTIGRFSLAEDGALTLSVSLSKASEAPVYADALRANALLDGVRTDSIQTAAGGCELTLTLTPRTGEEAAP